MHLAQCWREPIVFAQNSQLSGPNLGDNIVESLVMIPAIRTVSFTQHRYAHTKYNIAVIPSNIMLQLLHIGNRK